MKKVKIIICILVVTILAGIINISYGYFNKIHIIESALDFRLPDNYNIISYSYCMGKFEAMIKCDENSYNYFKGEFGRVASYSIWSLSDINLLEELNALKIFNGKEIKDATQYVGNISPINVWGVFVRLDGETFIYICKPKPEGLRYDSLVQDWVKREDIVTGHSS